MHSYNHITEFENLLFVWRRFLRGKRKKKDVIQFQSELAKNLLSLHKDLGDKTYTHGSYTSFNISDPKPRIIHKSSVRDRVVHHLLHKELYPYFDERFIHDSYSCRENKGVHKALDRFTYFARKVSKNNTQTCWALKCDIRKFFASIDHEILKNTLARHISDLDILGLLEDVISSFHIGQSGKGLPLGNLTSQLLVNIYMHEFDMYVKQELRAKYYIRYADDFVIFHQNREYLKKTFLLTERFLQNHLNLSLHSRKVSIKTFASGVDFLGWVHFPHHRQIRTTTKRRIARNLKNYPTRETINSYRAVLSHGDTHELQNLLKL